MVYQHGFYDWAAGAPVFAALLQVSLPILSQSISESVVPNQWKMAVIIPAPKVAKPTQPGDFRLIFITPVLSRSTNDISSEHIFIHLSKPHQTA